MKITTVALRMLTIAGAFLVLTSPAENGSAQSPDGNEIAALLDSEKVIFGVFSEKTREDASRLAGDELVDFVFYDMETGPFDVAGMRGFMESLGGRPIAARLPAIREGRDEARGNARSLLDAGVDAVVFPHVEDRAQAELAASAMGDAPAVSILIIEDKLGVQNAREIVATPGIDIVFPGPGDLRRAYEGDGPAIEKAIQTVLSACKEHEVDCGITAGPDDIEKRLEEGFRVIIVTSHEALPIGRRASGRR